MATYEKLKWIRSCIVKRNNPGVHLCKDQQNAIWAEIDPREIKGLLGEDWEMEVMRLSYNVFNLDFCNKRTGEAFKLWVYTIPQAAIA